MINQSPEYQITAKSIVRILLLTILFFVLINIVFAVLNPELGYYSLYDHLFIGRKRFPFGENPELSYNFSLNNINAMFESHEIEAIVPDGEFSVFIIGDSSVWGTLLKPEETLTGQLNGLGLSDESTGQPVRFYNLGYPTISVTKDLLILGEALGSYSPDMVIWLTTLEAISWSKQLSSPLVQNNGDRLYNIVQATNLPYELNSPELKKKTFWDRTVIGQRRELADLIRLQLYGVLWDATGIDQFYPDVYTLAQYDLEADESYYNFPVGSLGGDELAFDVLEAGRVLCGGSTRFIVVNEPIMISSGENSDIRYNFYYPRWVYDQYRDLIFATAEDNRWNYYDLWNTIPESEFTNSAIHLTPQGESILAMTLKEILISNEGFTE